MKLPDDWTVIAEDLNTEGRAVIPGLLGAEECRTLATLYRRPELFRSRITMSRHGFGRGEYQYFAYPLPAQVQVLRRGLYAGLVPTANQWSAALGEGWSFPAEHAEFVAQCQAAGQVRPTPLLLEYGAGDYNCLHQDVYGALVFPIQVAILLARPGDDFTGGEFVLTEQRPRMQSRVNVVDLRQGDGVAFAVRDRPVQGRRGIYRVKMRHGVSQLHEGKRHTLGIIFHESE